MSHQQPTPIAKDRAGLSVGYRFRWRVMYHLLAWGGPPHRALDADPRERLRRERAARVAAAHARHAATPAARPAA
ncbi:hypothetical protein FB554_2119 [Barrientosiimonas humi]|uniref:Uncharacterized protein n=2 Tax=Barrientosiimonas TaxID=1535207 RepID=A0A542XDQ0_9MICO|nr:MULTISPECIES: hypothetical protein [Barrientosiimonas]TQL33962.1 hypothetical protein FB554_2119 [Barrientosiimonas humi]BDZ58926.1 hypothetical protein GCM10025872_25830 [Barrientosiimonas endolithica]CAG7573952.1 hypothetical protein BH39T_PBIAJDOK_02594 [Barrientosiimonas humi]